MAQVELNCDMGERAGDAPGAKDVALMASISRANIACGAHAGNPSQMAAIMALAKQHNVAIGAHPSFDDRAGFGRTRMNVPADELQALLTAQIELAANIAAQNGMALSHVKPHGALSNMAEEDPAIAAIIVRAAQAVDASLAMLAMSGLCLGAAAEQAGMPVIREAFIDRAYMPTGHLMPRAQPGAVIHDPAQAAIRAVKMIDKQCVLASDGAMIPAHINSLCVHGDTDGAARIAQQVRTALVKAGHRVAAYRVAQKAAP